MTYHRGILIRLTPLGFFAVHFPNRPPYLCLSLDVARIVIDNRVT